MKLDLRFLPLIFSGPDGVMWSVREVNGPRASLIFHSSDMARRVRKFPENWRQLGAVALMKLSWKT